MSASWCRLNWCMICRSKNVWCYFHILHYGCTSKCGNNPGHGFCHSSLDAALEFSKPYDLWAAVAGGRHRCLLVCIYCHSCVSMYYAEVHLVTVLNIHSLHTCAHVYPESISGRKQANWQDCILTHTHKHVYHILSNICMSLIQLCPPGQVSKVQVEKV